MKKISKILIGYDGSACSDAALDDLKHAGLPSSLEAVLMTVADIIAPPADDELPDAPAIRIPEVDHHAQMHAAEALKEARAKVEKAAKRIKGEFAEWQLRTEVDCDAPAWALIKMAHRLQVDLVILGSHRHSVAGGRLILGSTSQRVLHEAHCSVRVARCAQARNEGPARLIVGFNGSADSEAAIDAVASRAWPQGSEARVMDVNALSSHALTAPVQKLYKAGLIAFGITGKGEPGHVLIQEAEEWGADSIFVGTRDLHGFQHLLHGSVSSTVAARAQCSVEVVRQS